MAGIEHLRTDQPTTWTPAEIRGSGGLAGRGGLAVASGRLLSLGAVSRAGGAGRERGLRSARLDLRLEAGKLVVDRALGAELVELAIDVVLAGAKR